jgi:hypothetical protein
MESLSQVPPKVNPKTCAICALNRGTPGAPACAGGYKPDRRGWCGGWRAIPEPITPEERGRRVAAAMENWATYCDRIDGLRSHHRRNRSHLAEHRANVRRHA